MCLSTAATIRLRSSDGFDIDVERHIACESRLVKDTLGNQFRPGGPYTVSLPKVSRKVLQVVLDWCTYHANGSKPISKSSRARITPWERRFFEKLDDSMIAQVMRAAGHMGINYLLAICCQIAVTSSCVLRTFTADLRGGNSMQLPIITTMECLLLEQAIQKNQLLTEKAMASAEGRMTLSELQHLRRQKMFERHLRIHDRWNLRFDRRSGASYELVRSAKIRKSWERENMLLQRALEWSSCPTIPLVEAFCIH